MVIVLDGKFKIPRITNKSFTKSPFGEKPSGMKKSIGNGKMVETLFERSVSSSSDEIVTVFSYEPLVSTSADIVSVAEFPASKFPIVQIPVEGLYVPAVLLDET